MDSEDRKMNHHPVDPRHSEMVRSLASAREQLASIIHEISEPVTAVTLNARAAQQALAIDPPDLVIARASVQCLIRDSRDIVEIVTRLHALFRGV
jgi:hypothetical protein